VSKQEKKLATRWRHACANQWADVGSACARCKEAFELGQLMLIFGQAENAAQQPPVLCDVCGMFAIEERRVFPVACAMFVPRYRRGNSLDRLAPRERGRVADTFARMDALTEGLERWHKEQLRRAGSGSTTPAGPVVERVVRAPKPANTEARAANEDGLRVPENALDARTAERMLVAGPKGDPS
jgi:hypothetical protein